ncbi:DUF4142 domain-containing protein [Variovorax sp. J22P168]|uniref:DUF4142 domain-containing protein n=1 Tax=Variovorax jilinensis TaxID=3053513 RepID=UPI002577518B|nr:DUF4142 domain-containing protein [Variovorax sp. J22P168]MDM0015854.1 DUF4142 domain-containing protein [Variovorax sp. J22P168]
MAFRSMIGALLASAAIALSFWAVAPASATPDRLDKADADLLVAIDAANRAEIASGTLALEKSGNTELKELADAMIADHTKAGIEIKKLAVARNFKFPADAKAERDSPWPELAGVESKGFDQVFVRAAIAHHVVAEQLLKRTQMSAQDVELRELAARMLPVAQGHLQSARRLTPR